ncbi:MAG: hypothetical protein ABS69_13190 [Nitrosomonadales bacterium SCN 54-20]|nr:MAG: hypothetical protein ABS69_13190 [Nitrosomonadales bacterium SCN 54-20]
MPVKAGIPIFLRDDMINQWISASAEMMIKVLLKRFCLCYKTAAFCPCSLLSPILFRAVASLFRKFFAVPASPFPGPSFLSAIRTIYVYTLR